MARIHSSAIVDPGAELDADVEVGAYSVIGAGVRVAAGTRIGPHVVVEGPTSIGRGNRIFQFASIGADPQDKKYGGEPTALEIGDGNTIREFVTINRGTAQHRAVTRVGSDAWIMAYVHIAHDVRLGSHTVLANNATLAGHVHIGDWAFVGGLAGVHQFVKVGAHAMIGFQGHVAQDVAPYMTVDGNPLAVRAVNVVGLKRRGFTAEQMAVIRQMHKLIFRTSLTLEQAKLEIAALRGQGGDDDIDAMLGFLGASTRGLVR